MTKETPKPNILVTIFIAYISYQISLKTCDYFKFFKLKETVATINARKIIDAANNIKFISAGPAKWEKLEHYDNSCINDNGKINWSIVEFYVVQPSGMNFSRPSRMPPMSFASEHAFFYRFTDGIIPRHLSKKFLTFKKGDHIYVSWKNIIQDESSIADPSYKDITCSKILNEAREPTSEEMEEYKNIEPELFSRPGP